MKKNLFTALCLVMTIAFVATGCNDDDKNPPIDGEDPISLIVSNTPTSPVAATGGPVSFNVESNGAWTIDPVAETWVAVTPMSGTGNGTVSVTVEPNDGDARFVTLNIKTADFNRNVTISQTALGVTVLPTEDLGNGTTDGSFKITESRRLTADKIYNLRGYVYVPDGVTLTIDPGVTIKGRSRASLIVQRGGKIMAQGEKNNPIVFTSAVEPGQRRPGDWGGLIILGKAHINDPSGEKPIEGGVPNATHGGIDDNDNSGVLSYVRIEFAGVEFVTDSEINGLTLGSVGRGTTIDHVQVSYCGDDSYEWFGGTVNAKYIISYSTWDDDFDTDNGFSGNIQYGLIMRNPKIADKSASNGFESDNNSNGDPLEPFTSPVFANISSFGPVTDPNNFTDEGNVNGSVPGGVFQSGVQLRRSTRTSLFNSVVAGWPIGLIIENDKTNAETQEWATQNLLRINNVILAGMQKNFQDKAVNAKPVLNETNGQAFVSDYFNTRSGNGTLASIADLNLTALPTLNNPAAIPAGDSPLATGAAWTDDFLDMEFFDDVEYLGAFAPTETADDNWTSGWTNFDPQNTVY